MNFNELEQIMYSKGVNTLAEIARALATTPQAVSNWKARDQVPHHIVIRIYSKIKTKSDSTLNPQQTYLGPQIINRSEDSFGLESMSFSNILLTLAEQLKVVFLVPFISIFLTFTYVQFIVQPKYMSSSTIVLPGKKESAIGGLSGLASQFGVNLPVESDVDLSSPTLFPELIQSRTFAEKIIDKEFYTKLYGKKLTLLDILTYNQNSELYNRDQLISKAVKILNNDYIDFDQDPKSPISVLNVKAFEPQLAKELNEVVISELESLNRYYKSQSVSEKIIFINERISSVLKDLDISERRLKEFNEKNRQLSSPTLQLEFDRRTRNVEVQEGIYLTLKQQLELAKIEEVQEVSIVQILDKPQVPLSPYNKDVKVKLILSSVLGVAFGILFAFVRSYFNNDNMEERKRIRRIRHFIKKKGKDLFLDKRMVGIISFLLIAGLPFYLGSKSQNPVFFNMYSTKLMLLNTVYVLTLLFSSILYIYLIRKKN